MKKTLAPVFTVSTRYAHGTYLSRCERLTASSTHSPEYSAKSAAVKAFQAHFCRYIDIGEIHLSPIKAETGKYAYFASIESFPDASQVKPKSPVSPSAAGNKGKKPS